MTRRSLIATVAFAGLTFMGTITPAIFAADEAKTVSAGNAAFATDLYARISSPDKNVFFSPYSISAALGMTAGGAKGNTADEMSKVLHLGDLPTFQTGISAISSQINGKEGEKRPYELSVANALWADQTFPLDAPFVAMTQQFFGTAGVFPVDFLNNAEASRTRINTWVEGQTANKIKDLIPEGAVDKSTALVLTNAIYFKGTWANPFPKDATADETFHVTPGKDVTVPMMKAPREASFNYMETDDFQAVSLPYKTAPDVAAVGGGPRGRPMPVPSDLSMLVILPKDPAGLAAIEKTVTPDNITKWASSLHRQNGMQVFLPRFTLTCSFELSQQLQALGMKQAFTRGADFSGISSSADGKLYISAVLHKAFVDVNEEGTEAAAATGVVMMRSAVMQQPITFRADHPFLFLIRHEPTGSILFMGHVTNPKE